MGGGGGGGRSSLSRAGSGNGVSLGGRGRGRSHWCVSAGVGVVGVGGGLRVVCRWSGPGGGGGGGGGSVGVALLVAGGAGVGVLSWMGVWASRRVLWALCVRVVRVWRPLASRGVELGGGCLGIWVGLWFVGSGRLLMGGAGRHGLRLRWLPVVLGCSVHALVLLVRVHGPPRVCGGAWSPEGREPVQRGWQVVLDCVAAVVGVCRLRVVPGHRWERWQGLVVVVGVSVVHVMVWCGPVCRVGWVAYGGRLRWGVVVIQLVGVAVVFGHRGVGVGGGGGVLMVLVVPRSLALRQWRSLCGVDLCG